MKKYILPTVLILVVLWLIFDKITTNKLTDEFKAKQDNLIHIVDSLVKDNHQKDLQIIALEKSNCDLQKKINEAKGKVKIITKWVDSSKLKIDSYTEQELVSSFNKRYPKDTTTNPLPLPQPVLVEAAKDLVELDGAKIQLSLQDTIINNLESRVNLKDSTISLYVGKETNYKNIVNNQQIQINDWQNQYKQIQAQNKKLKFQNKLSKIGNGIVVGSLLYLLIVK